MVTALCRATTTWPEIPPHGVRLACDLPEGHDGEHACAHVIYLDEPNDPTDFYPNQQEIN